jgi:hypothetical protein
MKNGNNNQELEGISDWFISVNGEKIKGSEPSQETRTKECGLTDKGCEVDELVTIRRRITVPNTQNAQDSMKELLQQHLEDRFALFRVELRRTAANVETKARKSKREEVIILLKESSS